MCLVQVVPIILSVLTRYNSAIAAHNHGIVIFSRPVIDPDTGPRTPRPGPLNFSNNYALMEYMAANDLAPTLFTLGNELTDNISPTVAADDYNTLAKAVNEIWPDENERPG